MSEDSVAGVEPTIGSPTEGVERFVSVVNSETIQKNLRFPVGTIIFVGIGEEKEIGRCSDPDPTEADFESTDLSSDKGSSLTGR